MIPSLVTAYLLQERSLAVNHQLELPQVVPHVDDMIIHQEGPHIIVARSISIHDPIPDGFTLTPFRQLLNQWSTAQFEQASRAIQLLEWKQNHRFCSHCGHPTRPHHKDYAMVCTSCRYHQYPRVQPCVIMAITRGKQILLARPANRSNGVFSVLAGFVEVGETLEQAVARETFEETAVRVKNIRYMGSQPWPFPTNLMIAFQAEYDGGDIIPQEGEIAEADFYDFDNLPPLPFRGSIAYRMIQQIKAQAEQ
jgi:NAD+ diphosphatase